MNGNYTEYFISPRVPGVRPADDPDYDGITFVYVFTTILTPWTVPPAFHDVTVTVANSQGFVAGMTVAIDNAGYYEVVATTALDRMTIKNLGYPQNLPPGSGLGAGNVTTTSLPGPQGAPGADGPPGAGIEIQGTVPTYANLPTIDNTYGDVWVTTDTGHGWAWTAPGVWVDIGPIQGPPGIPGTPGVDGTDGVNAFTATAVSAFTVPAVGGTTVVTVVDASWIVVGQLLYVDTAGGGPGLAGALVVQAKSGNTLTLLNPVPPAAGGGGGTAPIQVFGEIPTGAIDGANTVFTSSAPFRTNSVAVFLNGLRQRRANDYNETGNQAFAFLSPPLPGDSLSIDYMEP